MKNTLTTLWITFIVLLTLGITIIVISLVSPTCLVYQWNLDKEFSSNYGSYIVGVISVLFSIISIFIILITILKQKIDGEKTQLESHFFKMLDYHNEIVKNLNVKHIDESKLKAEGRRAFVVFRLQLVKLLEIVESINSNLKLNLTKKEIIDLAYLTFYYGIDEEWQDLLKSKVNKKYSNEFITELLRYKNELLTNNKIHIGRTNQTSLSVYFRNMYNAIRLVNDSKILDFKEKKRLIKIYRAQLSNPELYVIFLNIESRFGKKWLEENDNLIIKYEFIKNLPLVYCGEYSPKEHFDMNYEEEELMN